MKDLEYYQSIEWPVILTQAHDDGDYFIATIEQMPGLIATGETAEEALAEAKDASNVWLEEALKKGYQITIPDTSDIYKGFSGKVSLRMPKSLHKRLTKLAKLEGMSINSYINYVIGQGIANVTATAKISTLHTTRLENISIEDENTNQYKEQNKYNSIATKVLQLQSAG